MILVRHAQPGIEPDVPPVEWRLSSTGRSRARSLAVRLIPFGPDAICSSPEPKALETATILGTMLDLEITIVEELREHERIGTPFLTERGAFEERIRALLASPGERVFGSESGSEALARFRTGIAAVRALDAREPVIVTHGTVMALYIGAELGLDPFDVWQELAMPCLVHTGDWRDAHG